MTARRRIPDRALACAGAVLVTALAVTLAVAAGAQALEPGVQIGGEVPSYLSLSIDAPRGFATFPAAGAAKSYVLSIHASVTASIAGARLSVGDGEAGAGAALGRLRGADALTTPLGAGVDGRRLQPLNTIFGIALASWREPVSDAATALRICQRVSAGPARGGYHKLLYLTLSAETP